MLHKLWIEKGESCKLVLIQIHHKDFVGGRQIRLFRGELPIKIAHVFAVSLEWASKKETSNKVAKKEKVLSKFVAYVSLQKNECGKEVKIFEKNGQKSWLKRKALKSEVGSDLGHPY